MSAPRVVTPQEAELSLPAASTRGPVNWEHRLVYTVSTEPERIAAAERAAAVRALRKFGQAIGEVENQPGLDQTTIERVRWTAIEDADAIENGADL